MTKTLYIIRGLPGSGKTTLGKTIAGTYCYAADDYFDLFHDGEFVPSKIKSAHKHCHLMVETALSDDVPFVAVTNTFTQEWEFEQYIALAERYGYTVHSIIVENRHGNKSVHEVPEGTVQKMRNRFKVKL